MVTKNHALRQDVVDYILNHNQHYYRLAYSYVKNTEDALDIVQESILKSLKSLGSLQEPRYIKTWFYRILTNTALDHLRKNNRFNLADEELLASHSYEQISDRNFDLQAALDSLPPNYRSIIILRFFEDLKLEDIATILNINVSTVKSRLYTALKNLRIELDETEV